jgi:hypothetical protein
MDELLDNEKTTRTPTSTPKLNTPGEWAAYFLMSHINLIQSTQK